MLETLKGGQRIRFASTSISRSWSNYGPMTDYGPFPFDREKANTEVIHPSLKFLADLIPENEKKLWTTRGEHSFAALSDVPGEPEYPGWHGWWSFNKRQEYRTETDRDPMPDERYTRWASEMLQKPHGKPFIVVPPGGRGPLAPS